MDCIQLSLFGKTYQEHSVPTEEKISEPCWKNLPALNSQTFQFLDLRVGGRWSKAGAIAGNGWSLAWRQLDAQYWGVPQRRKRIALVVDFAGQRAGEILFERTSLSRHPDSRIPAWKEIAGLTANCPAGNDGVVGAGRGRKGDGNADCRRTETDKTGEAGRSEREERTDKRESREAAAYSLKIRSGCAGGGKGALVQTEKVGTLSTLQDQTIFQLVQAGEIIPINTQIATRHISMGEKQVLELERMETRPLLYRHGMNTACAIALRETLLTEPIRQWRTAWAQKKKWAIH